MRRALLLAALLTTGCAAGSTWLTLGAAAARTICGAAGCPCAASGRSGAELTHTDRTVRVEVLPDGTVGRVVP